MTHFKGNLCQCTCYHAQCGDVLRMMVTLYDLGRYDFGGKAHFFADVFFHKRINVRISSYGAR